MSENKLINSNYKNFIILDLEATCWEGRRNTPNEIIEIGAVKVNSENKIIDEFCEFVKPLLIPKLSDFCTELTSITQSDVDSSDRFDIVIKRFQDWINIEEPYILCSWGFYDKKQFIKDCDLHQIPKEWLENHISLKHQYAEIKKLRRAIGMKNALINENIKLSGTHHRGIDDARNITKIFLKYINKWEKD